MATQKITAASLLASGRVRLTKTPEQVSQSRGGRTVPFGAGAIISKADFYSDKPHGMLAVTPLSQRSPAALDREMNAQIRRLSGYEGLQDHERETF